LKVTNWKWVIIKENIYREAMSSTLSISASSKVYGDKKQGRAEGGWFNDQ